MVNFEAFCWNFSLSTNSILPKSNWRAQQLHITMGAIKSGFRISIYKDRTNGDKNVRKMKKKLLFFLFLLIQGIDEFMVY